MADKIVDLTSAPEEEIDDVIEVSTEGDDEPDRLIIDLDDVPDFRWLTCDELPLEPEAVHVNGEYFMKYTWPDARRPGDRKRAKRNAYVSYSELGIIRPSLLNGYQRPCLLNTAYKQSASTYVRPVQTLDNVKPEFQSYFAINCMDHIPLITDDAYDALSALLNEGICVVPIIDCDNDPFTSISCKDPSCYQMIRHGEITSIGDLVFSEPTILKGFTNDVSDMIVGVDEIGYLMFYSDRQCEGLSTVLVNVEPGNFYHPQEAYKTISFELDARKCAVLMPGAYVKSLVKDVLTNSDPSRPENEIIMMKFKCMKPYAAVHMIRDVPCITDVLDDQIFNESNCHSNYARWCARRFMKYVSYGYINEVVEGRYPRALFNMAAEVRDALFGCVPNRLNWRSVELKIVDLLPFDD